MSYFVLLEQNCPNRTKSSCRKKIYFESHPRKLWHSDHALCAIDVYVVVCIIRPNCPYPTPLYNVPGLYGFDKELFAIDSAISRTVAIAEKWLKPLFSLISSLTTDFKLALLVSSFTVHLRAWRELLGHACWEISRFDCVCLKSVIYLGKTLITIIMISLEQSFSHSVHTLKSVVCNVGPLLFVQFILNAALIVSLVYSIVDRWRQCALKGENSIC
jgi:hypothetical protein